MLLIKEISRTKFLLQHDSFATQFKFLYFTENRIYVIYLTVIDKQKYFVGEFFQVTCLTWFKRVIFKITLQLNFLDYDRILT